MSMIACHATNGMHIVDSVADLALGKRVLRSAQHSSGSATQCPWRSSSNCAAHWAAGAAITTASVLDMTAVLVLLYGTHPRSRERVTSDEVACSRGHHAALRGCGVCMCSPGVHGCCKHNLLAAPGTESRWATHTLLLRMRSSSSAVHTC